MRPWTSNLYYNWHISTLAYCRPIHLISVEFQNIDNNPATPAKTCILLIMDKTLIYGLLKLYGLLFKILAARRYPEKLSKNLNFLKQKFHILKIKNTSKHRIFSINNS
jgi:hypothetical protein